MSLFRIDGLDSEASENRLRRAVARHDARIRLVIDRDRGLVEGEGAEPPEIEAALQAAAAAAGLVFRGPIAPHHDMP